MKKTFKEKMQDPKNHIAAQKIIRARLDLDNRHLKIKSWCMGRAGIEVEFEDTITGETKWVELGR